MLIIEKYFKNLKEKIKKKIKKNNKQEYCKNMNVLILNNSSITFLDLSLYQSLSSSEPHLSQLEKGTSMPLAMFWQDLEIA